MRARPRKQQKIFACLYCVRLTYARVKMKSADTLFLRPPHTRTHLPVPVTQERGANDEHSVTARAT